MHRWLLPAIVLLAAAFRLVALNAPLLDGMLVKQIYVAQRVRAIAEPPYDPRRSTFDILTPRGERLEMIEEIPLYPTVVALGYTACGEHECLGRLASILATLTALLALYDLARHSFGSGPALAAAFFFAVSPLTIFYGQAFQADAAMVAMMLLATCAWRRFLSGNGWGWWFAALLFAALAGCCKYFGLMVLPALAWMTWQERGLKIKYISAGLILAVFAAMPVAIWMICIFGRNPTPADDGIYFIHQMPELLTSPMLYLRFLDRFLYKDCGPVLSLFAVAGIISTLRTPARCSWLTGWTIMGLIFYMLLGPKLRYHNYYEFMMIPAACGWAAVAWQRFAARSVPLAIGLLFIAAVVQSPWISHANFEQERGMLRAAEMLTQHSQPEERTLIFGPCTQCGIMHYARRNCWLSYNVPTRAELDLRRSQGARFLLIYINHEHNAEYRQACDAVAKKWPIIERATGPWSIKGRPTEIILLDLR